MAQRRPDECFYHGPMVRYLKGKIVSTDESSTENGIYVHRKCLEWAPRVCFEDDVVMNLELEIRRASKLKCCRCGLRGAALGCFYDRCNKSFHVPCALQTFGCSWDPCCHHMLCPQHASQKLPCDGLSSQTKENDNSCSLPQSTCSRKEKLFQREGQQIDQHNISSSSLPLGQGSDKQGNFDGCQRENQPTDQLKTSNLSSLPQSQCSRKEGNSTDMSREGQQIDPPDISSFCSLPLGQPSDDEEISQNHEIADKKPDELNTSNSYSLPRTKEEFSSVSHLSSCHPDKGISDGCQAEETIADQLDTSSCPSDLLVVLGSCLSASEKDDLQKFASWTNASVAKEWAKNVTHVIVGKGADRTWIRSYEVLMAILSGKWVLQFEWIVDSLELRPDLEASYEVTFMNDSLRTVDGPKKGRIAAAEGAPKLFSGLQFRLSAYMNPDDRKHMQDLIAAAGGQMLEGCNLHSLGKKSADPSAKFYFIYGGSPPREFSQSSWIDLRKEVEAAKEHAASGAQVISHFRVLDAIAAYDVQVLDQKGRCTPDMCA
ncbi:hypothetical protein ACP70R_034178 [Stipagrostis hirtigluma subsp. patula]